MAFNPTPIVGGYFNPPRGAKQELAGSEHPPTARWWDSVISLLASF